MRKKEISPKPSQPNIKKNKLFIEITMSIERTKRIVSHKKYKDLE
jgi:hypothetical protein